MCCELTCLPFCFSCSDVVTMALQMSPVDAHSENQPPCYYKPAVKLPEAAAGTSSQVEPFQCQLLECSSVEQVPLPTVSFCVTFLYSFYSHFHRFLFYTSPGTEPCATKSNESRTKGVWWREGGCCF